MQLSAKVYILTGAGGAIAGSIAQAFAAAGARLALVDRHSEALEARAKALDAEAFAANLLSYPEVEGLVREVKRRMGRVDGLIHTVGGFGMGKLAEVEVAQYEQMFDLNLRSLFYAVRAVLPELIAQQDGFIAGIAAGAAWSGAGPGIGLYAAAKSAVATLLRSLDGELGGTQVRVAVLYPMGPVDTPANRRDMPGTDPATWIDPAEIGETLVYAASRSARGRLLELKVHPPR
jgi:NADP-dependent 3-hydroxy acid dehydrogenase YdfG